MIVKNARLAGTHIFYLFAIGTAGTWHDTVIELTQEIDRSVTTMTEDTWKTTFLFQCLFVVVKGDAVSHRHHQMKCRCSHLHLLNSHAYRLYGGGSKIIIINRTICTHTSHHSAV